MQRNNIQWSATNTSNQAEWQNTTPKTFLKTDGTRDLFGQNAQHVHALHGKNEENTTITIKSYFPSTFSDHSIYSDTNVCCIWPKMLHSVNAPVRFPSSESLNHCILI